MLDFQLVEATDIPFEIGRLETTHQLPATARPHRHSYYQIIWVLGGAGMHATDFEEHAIRPPQVFLISPGQVHAVRVDRPLRGYMLLFTADFFAVDGLAGESAADLPFFRLGVANPVLALAADEAAHLRAIAEDLLAEFASRAAWRREMLRARFQILLLALGRVAQRQQAPVAPVMPATSTVARFQALVEERFSSMHRVADYAGLLGLTPGHLNDLTKTATGRTASALIDARLVLEAKRLLAHSDTPAAEIATDLGFPDASYFGRFFRRHVAQPPGAFRAAIREKYQRDR